MKAILGLFLSLSLTLQPALAAVKNPDTFTHLTTSDLDSLDPAWSYDTSSHSVIASVYEYLFGFKGATLELEPVLATKVPSVKNGLLSKDGLTYTVPIRKGVKFHDGQTLTPEDVRYSLLRFMLFDRAGGPSALVLEPVLGLQETRDGKGTLLPDVFSRAEKAVTVKGDNVVIRLARPYAPFLSILASFGAIISKDWCLKNGEWDGTEATLAKHNNPGKGQSALHDKTNGTGPFRLERWEKAVKQVVMVRFDGYWRGPARLKRVILKAVEEFNTRKLMLQAGDADSIVSQLMTLPQVRSIPDVEVIERLEKLESATMLGFAFAINTTANPNVGSGKLDGAGIPPDFFGDKDIRKAFAYAFDYDSYVRDMLQGQGAQASGIIPPGLIGHWARKPLYRFDLKKAEEHFRKAWAGQAWEKGFRFTLVANEGQPGVLALCNMLRKNIEAVNPKFQVDVRPIQWSTFLTQSQAKMIPVFLISWAADYPDAHNFAFPFLHSSGYFPTKQGYKNPEMDKLVEQAVAAVDVKEREGLYLKLQQLADDDLPHLALADGYRYRTQRKWVKGWVFNPIHPPDAPYGSDYYKVYKAD